MNIKLKCKCLNWDKLLNAETEKPYFSAIFSYIAKEEAHGKIVLPPADLILNSLNLCHFDDVKVVILGQDPYHGIRQANGLSFSVENGVKIPPSLQNIFKELHNDLNIPIRQNGSLTNWAKQGVLLLNAILTVNKSEPASHKKIGWHIFTDKIIQAVSNEREKVVFLLWGQFAINKAHLIDSKKHLILTAPHPSPFSAHKGFIGCKHFSKTNQFLEKNNFKPINWAI